jgi:hypothetical protein
LTFKAVNVKVASACKCGTTFHGIEGAEGEAGRQEHDGVEADVKILQIRKVNPKIIRQFGDVVGKQRKETAAAAGENLQCQIFFNNGNC